MIPNKHRSCCYLILTGASGYLGQHLLKSLETLQVQRQKQEILVIHALVNNQDPKDLPELSFGGADGSVKIKWFRVDISDGKSIEEYWSRHEEEKVNSENTLCIHTAAVSSPKVCNENPNYAYQVNVPSLFFDKLAANNIPIVALSTDHVYNGTAKNKVGDNKLHDLYKETDSTNPVNTYGKTKVKMEQYLFSLPTKSHVVVLRSSMILGKKPNHTAHGTFLQFCASRTNTPTSYFTNEYRNVVSIETVIEVLQWYIHHLLINQDDDNNNDDNDDNNKSNKTYQSVSSGIYNMGGPININRYDLALKVMLHFKIPSPTSVLQQAKQTSPNCPLDIGMDSSKLYSLTNIQPQTIDHIIQSTFDTI